MNGLEGRKRREKCIYSTILKAKEKKRRQEIYREINDRSESLFLFVFN